MTEKQEKPQEQSKTTQSSEKENEKPVGVSFGFLAQQCNRNLGDPVIDRMRNLLTQQKIVLCAAGCILHSKSKTSNYGDVSHCLNVTNDLQLRDRYVAVCKQLKISAATMSEFKDACDSVIAAGLMTLNKAKVEKLQKMQIAQVSCLSLSTLECDAHWFELAAHVRVSLFFPART